jgi:hypothetical protein
MAAGMMKSSNLQVPSSKEAPNPKLQIFCRFGRWDLELGTYLELGDWRLELQ